MSPYDNVERVQLPLVLSRVYDKSLLVSTLEEERKAREHNHNTRQRILDGFVSGAAPLVYLLAYDSAKDEILQMKKEREGKIGSRQREAKTALGNKGGSRSEVEIEEKQRRMAQLVKQRQ